MIANDIAGLILAAFALSILGLCISWGRTKTTTKEES